MSPSLAASIDIATDLAWRQLANLPAGSAYDERRALHRELVARVGSVRLSANASAELRCLVAAMRRVAAASFSNRWGRPYQERRQALLELRGCIDTWRRSEGR